MTGVELSGLEPTDFLHAMEVLYQLSYSPEERLTIPAAVASFSLVRSTPGTLAAMTETARPARRRARSSATTPRLANEIEAKWQDRWDADHTFWAPNPTGTSRDGFADAAGRRKLYVLDMFPYPSGTGLHVGHPLGYIGTDVYARFMRMHGHNVLHADGLRRLRPPRRAVRGRRPASTRGRPREANVANMRRQLRALGLGHDPRRSVATTDVGYYRWTQWIFLQLYDSWYDDDQPVAPDRSPSSPTSSRPAPGSPTATPIPRADSVA